MAITEKTNLLISASISGSLWEVGRERGPYVASGEQQEGAYWSTDLSLFLILHITRKVQLHCLHHKLLGKFRIVPSVTENTCPNAFFLTLWIWTSFLQRWFRNTPSQNLPGAFDVLLNVFCMIAWNQRVFLTMNYKRGTFNERQQLLADIT